MLDPREVGFRYVSSNEVTSDLQVRTRLTSDFPTWAELTLICVFE